MCVCLRVVVSCPLSARLRVGCDGSRRNRVRSGVPCCWVSALVMDFVCIFYVSRTAGRRWQQPPTNFGRRRRPARPPFRWISATTVRCVLVCCGCAGVVLLLVSLLCSACLVFRVFEVCARVLHACWTGNLLATNLPNLLPFSRLPRCRLGRTGTKTPLSRPAVAVAWDGGPANRLPPATTTG